MTMVERVEALIQKENMVSSDDTLIVGVSGGADSLALLHCLLSLQEKNSLFKGLVVAHIQHGLRGEEGVADEEFVRCFCREKGIMCRVESADVSSLAKEWGTSLEDAGRRVRYDFFDRLAVEFAPAKIVTAHNRKDNAETLLLHLTRGSGLKGVGGISPVAGNRIRPLITTSREEIEAYCEEHHLLFRQDATNTDVSYSRNRVRLRVLPELKVINPRVEEALLRFSQSAREDDEYLCQQATALLNSANTAPHRYSLAAFQSVHPAIAMRGLRQMIEQECGIVPERIHIEQLLAMPARAGGVVLPGDHRVVTHGGDICFPETKCKENALSLPVCLEQTYTFDSASCSFELINLEKSENKQKIHNLVFKNLLDCDMINGTLCWHPRTEGDVFRPLGRPQKTLKKWLNEWRIPPWQRSAWPILRDDQGIVWVAGGGVAARVAVTEDSRRCLSINVEDKKD